MKVHTARQLVSTSTPLLPNGLSLAVYEREKKIQLNTAYHLIRKANKKRRQNVKNNRRASKAWRRRKH